MHRILSLVALCGLLISPAVLAGPDQIDISHVKVGQAYVFVTKMASAAYTMETEAVWTIKKIEAGKELVYDITTTTTMKIPGVSQPPRKHTMKDIKFPLGGLSTGAHGKMPAAMKGKMKKVGTETVKVDGIAFDCTIYQYTVMGKTSKTWIAKKFPMTIKVEVDGKPMNVLTKVGKAGASGDSGDSGRKEDPKEGKEEEKKDPAPAGDDEQTVTVNGYKITVKKLKQMTPGWFTFDVKVHPHDGAKKVMVYGKILLHNEAGEKVGQAAVYLRVPAAGANRKAYAKHKGADGKPVPWKSFKLDLKVIAR